MPSRFSMKKLRSGDIVKANSGVTGGQNRINYFPTNSTVKKTTVDSNGKPIPLKEGMIGYVCTSCMDDSDEEKEKVEKCVVNFNHWGESPGEETVISLDLPSTFLDLKTRFGVGDRVAANYLVDSRGDKVRYEGWSETPGDTPLARLREGSEGFVISSGFIVELNCSFQIESKHVQKAEGPLPTDSRYKVGEVLHIYVNLPPIFLTLLERFEDSLSPEEKQTLERLGIALYED